MRDRQDALDKEMSSLRRQVQDKERLRLQAQKALESLRADFEHLSERIKGSSGATPLFNGEARAGEPCLAQRDLTPFPLAVPYTLPRPSSGVHEPPAAAVLSKGHERQHLASICRPIPSARGQHRNGDPGDCRPNAAGPADDAGERAPARGPNPSAEHHGRSQQPPPPAQHPQLHHQRGKAERDRREALLGRGADEAGKVPGQDCQVGAYAARVECCTGRQLAPIDP